MQVTQSHRWLPPHNSTKHWPLKIWLLKRHPLKIWLLKRLPSKSARKTPLPWPTNYWSDERPGCEMSYVIRELSFGQLCRQIRVGPGHRVSSGHYFGPGHRVTPRDPVFCTCAEWLPYVHLVLVFVSFSKFQGSALPVESKLVNSKTILNVITLE